ncbi:DUF1648 domain-containing protein [Altererythrobacter sp.]|nr:DUF1648 domain-containing protein [Altererythrobacter sp.]
MPSVLALVVMVAAILFLCGSAIWTDQRYSRFDQIPAHYDFRGRATRFAPRTFMAWLVPALLSFILLGFPLLAIFIPAEMQNGDPTTGLIVMSLIFVGTQFFVLWLLGRWARTQA